MKEMIENAKDKQKEGRRRECNRLMMFKTVTDHCL